MSLFHGLTNIICCRLTSDLNYFWCSSLVVSSLDLTCGHKMGRIAKLYFYLRQILSLRNSRFSCLTKKVKHFQKYCNNRAASINCNKMKNSFSHDLHRRTIWCCWTDNDYPMQCKVFKINLNAEDVNGMTYCDYWFGLKCTVTKYFRVMTWITCWKCVL